MPKRLSTKQCNRELLIAPANSTLGNFQNFSKGRRSQIARLIAEPEPIFKIASAPLNGGGR